MPKNSNQKPDFLAKQAFLFGSGTLTSRVLGLVRDALLFSLMPLDIRDVWLAAFRLPNFFRRLLGEGGLSVSFIPVYVGLSSLDHKEQRQKLINGVFTLLMVTVLLICGFCFFFMESIVDLLLGGPGFTQVPGKQAMAARMAKIMVFFLFFISLFAFFMALLNGLKKFTLTGFAPLFLNLAIIVGLVLFKDGQELPEASAWAVLIGGSLQALVLLPSVIRSGVLPRLSFQVHHPLVKKVVLKFIPTVFGVGILQVLALVNLYFASWLPSGTISYIYLGDRLLELPLSLISVSIGTALLPTLSEYWGKNQKTLFLDCAIQHLRLFYFLALPAALGLWFMGLDIVDILFSRGEFTTQEAFIVSGLLKIYCISLLCAGSLKILNQSFYAAGDTLTPALISMVCLLVHLLLAPHLMARFAIYGLVLSTALITLLNFLFCAFFLQKRVGFLNWKSLGTPIFQFVLASVPLGLYLWSMKFFHWQQGWFAMDVTLLFIFIALGVLIYFFSASLLRVDEVQFLKKKILRKRS